MIHPLLESAIHDIRSSDALVVIGAGASLRAGMPLANQLVPLVWHTVDHAPALLCRLSSTLGVTSSSAKEILGDDWARIMLAFEQIASDPEARSVFQDSVCELNKARCAAISFPHDALARLIFARRVFAVLSLNWDTLLETAFRRRYGFWPMPAEFDFWKPHGDCAQPHAEWVLPHQPGVVPDLLVHRVSEFAKSRPRVLLIVGYSERDEAVVQRLICPMSMRWRVYRVSPSALGEGAIPMDAGTALEFLAEELAPDPDLPGWRSVSFDNQRGIEAAIAGERLDPRDVTSCPRLPHFTSALFQLDTLHSVNIAGASGSGKSITVWQLAHHYSQLGWHVVRPAFSSDATDRRRLDEIARKSWPTVVVVDDAHLTSSDFLHSLREQSDARTKTLLGTTDPNWEQQNTIRISAHASVKTLAEAYTIRRNEILPIVQRFDPHVGDDFLSMKLEDRIHSAAASDTPWQFAYALRGGWRQTRHILNAARDFQASDLLLSDIAIRQLASLDAGATLSHLSADARLLGHGDTWVDAALKRLQSQRLLLVGETIRCLHLQSAAAIVDLSFNAPAHDRARSLMALVQIVIAATDTPLRGISWLLHEIRNYRPMILTDEIQAHVVRRCFHAHSHVERRDASLLLAQLLGWKDLVGSQLVADFSEQLRTWIVGVTKDDAYGIGSLLNSLNDCKECCELLDAIDPRLIAEKLRECECKDGYG